MKILAISATLFCLFASQDVAAADWHFAGTANVEKGQVEYLFYDANTVTNLNGGLVRFWVEGILSRKSDAYIHKHEKVVVREAVKKVMAGYQPEVLGLDRYKKVYRNDEEMWNQAASITQVEIVANSESVNVASKIYFEIDCVNRKTRTLDLSSFDDNGKLRESDSKASSWRFIAPNSNSEDWAQLFCKK